jgi:hypothetical protein
MITYIDLIYISFNSANLVELEYINRPFVFKISNSPIKITEHLLGSIT